MLVLVFLGRQAGIHLNATYVIGEGGPVPGGDAEARGVGEHDVDVVVARGDGRVTEQHTEHGGHELVPRGRGRGRGCRRGVAEGSIEVRGNKECIRSLAGAYVRRKMKYISILGTLINVIVQYREP